MATAPEMGRPKGLNPSQSRDLVNMAISMGESGASQKMGVQAVVGICMIDGDPDSDQ